MGERPQKGNVSVPDLLTSSSFFCLQTWKCSPARHGVQCQYEQAKVLCCCVDPHHTREVRASDVHKYPARHRLMLLFCGSLKAISKQVPGFCPHALCSIWHSFYSMGWLGWDDPSVWPRVVLGSEQLHLKHLSDVIGHSDSWVCYFGETLKYRTTGALHSRRFSISRKQTGWLTPACLEFHSSDRLNDWCEWKALLLFPFGYLLSGNTSRTQGMLFTQGSEDFASSFLNIFI